MGSDDDLRIFRTFAEFEREELRRADIVGGAIDGLFDESFADEPAFDGRVRLGGRGAPDIADDEE